MKEPAPPVEGAEVDPILEHANISSDGVMVLVRGEAWKEAKLTVISRVTVHPAAASPPAQQRPTTSRRAHDPVVQLGQHSEHVGLWEAETMTQQQYLEGLRRGLPTCRRFSSVTAGAEWIAHMTATTVPTARQVLDWSHASQRLHLVRKALWGETSAAGMEWVQDRLDRLWEGQGAEVVAVLERWELDHARYPDAVRQAVGYFRGNAARLQDPIYRAAGTRLAVGPPRAEPSTWSSSG